MQADNSAYIKALDQATAKLKQHSEESNSIFGQIKEGLSDLAGDLAAAFTIDAIVEFSAAAIEAQASVEKLSKEFGISVERVSTLNLAFAQAGLGADQTGVAMKKFEQAISDASGDPASKAAVAFKLLGLNLADIKNQDPSVTLEQVAGKFAGLEDGPNKVAIAIALLGRQGQALIPFLNEGADGMDKLTQSAKDAGAILGGDAARAAEEFEQKLNLLKAEAVQGLGNAISAELLPTLNQLADAWTAGGGKAQGYAVIAQGIGFVLRSIGSIVLEVAREFETLGSAIGGAAAALGAAASGKFSEASSILEEQHKDYLAIQTKYANLQNALWDDTANKEIAAAKKAADGSAEAATGGKTATPNLAAGVKTAEADKEIEKYAQGLREQAQAFGLGAEAAARFKLSIGPLGDALKIADDEGKKAAASAIAYARALQIKKDEAGGDKLIAQLIEQGDELNKSSREAFNYKLNTGELGASLDRLAKSGKDLRPALEAAFDRKLVIQDQIEIDKLNIKLAEMKGNLVDAAKAQFDQQNKGLRTDLKQTGNTAGLQAVDETEKAELAMKAYDQEMAKATQIEQQYSQEVAKLNLLKAQQSITDNQYAVQLNALQQQQIASLTQVNTGVAQLAAQNPGIQALGNSAQEFQTKLIALKAQGVDPLISQVRNNLESAFADNFSKLISGAESFRDALKNFMKDIGQMFEQMIAKDYAQKLFGAGGPAGGAAGGIANIFQGNNGSSGLGGIASLFSGFFAGGGNIPAGQWGVVGENGPEPAYGGSTGLSIKPSGSMGGQTVVNHFTLPPQGGTISRQTQSQAATQVSRSLQIASRRNR